MKVYAKIKTSQLIVKKMPYSDIVQKMILITEKILPLGSVVEVDVRKTGTGNRKAGIKY